MRKTSVNRMTETAVLTAIVLIMSQTPLGYLRISALSVSLLSIPVAIGAMLIGPYAGLMLGAIFGISSYLQCFGISLMGIDALGASLASYNPFFTFLLCVPTRMLMGYLTGVTFKVLQKLDKKKIFCYFASSFCAAILNTILFVGALVLLFWNTSVIQNNSFGIPVDSIWVFIAAIVTLNGIWEAIIACVVGGTVSKSVAKVVHRI